MQNLLFIDDKIAKGSFWGRLGPILLLGSFAVMILKCAPLYWPLALTAFAGYATILYLQKKGFYLSLFILAAVLIILIRTGAEPLWPLLSAASIASSWLLIFLGDQDALSLKLETEEKISSLKENYQSLEKQLREAKIAVSKESRELISEKERLNAQLITMTAQLDQMQSELLIADKEKERNEALTQDIFAFQRKEIAFQHALEDAQTQLIKMKNQLAALQEPPKEIVSNIIPTDDVEPEEKIRLEQAQHQYANLREQFEEKSEKLDQTRKELFQMENEFLAWQKSSEEKANEISEDDFYLIRDLKTQEKECHELEVQVALLQDFITQLLSPKKRASRSKNLQIKKISRVCRYLFKKKLIRRSRTNQHKVKIS